MPLECTRPSSSSPARVIRMPSCGGAASCYDTYNQPHSHSANLIPILLISISFLVLYWEEAIITTGKVYKYKMGQRNATTVHQVVLGSGCINPETETQLNGEAAVLITHLCCVHGVGYNQSLEASRLPGSGWGTSIL